MLFVWVAQWLVAVRFGALGHVRLVVGVFRQQKSRRGRVPRRLGESYVAGGLRGLLGPQGLAVLRCRVVIAERRPHDREARTERDSRARDPGRCVGLDCVPLGRHRRVALSRSGPRIAAGSLLSRGYRTTQPEPPSTDFTAGGPSN